MTGKEKHLSRSEGRSRMWRSMRILRQFSVADLVATAAVMPSEAYLYIRLLTEAGYLQCLRLYKAGRGNSYPALWKLVRDTGPFAPKGGKHIDPNLDPTRGGTHVSIPRAEYERALACVRACAGMADPQSEIAALKRMKGDAP